MLRQISPVWASLPQHLLAVWSGMTLIAKFVLSICVCTWTTSFWALSFGVWFVPTYGKPWRATQHINAWINFPIWCVITLFVLKGVWKMMTESLRTAALSGRQVVVTTVSALVILLCAMSWPNWMMWKFIFGAALAMNLWQQCKLTKDCLKRRLTWLRQEHPEWTPGMLLLTGKVLLFPIYELSVGLQLWFAEKVPIGGAVPTGKLCDHMRSLLAHFIHAVLLVELFRRWRNAHIAADVEKSALWLTWLQLIVVSIPSLLEFAPFGDCRFPFLGWNFYLMYTCMHVGVLFALNQGLFTLHPIAAAQTEAGIRIPGNSDSYEVEGMVYFLTSLPRWLWRRKWFFLACVFFVLCACLVPASQVHLPCSYLKANSTTSPLPVACNTKVENISLCELALLSYKSYKNNTLRTFRKVIPTPDGGVEAIALSGTSVVGDWMLNFATWFGHTLVGALHFLIPRVVGDKLWEEIQPAFIYNHPDRINQLYGVAPITDLISSPRTTRKRLLIAHSMGILPASFWAAQLLKQDEYIVGFNVPPVPFKWPNVITFRTEWDVVSGLSLLWTEANATLPCYDPFWSSCHSLQSIFSAFKNTCTKH